MGAARAGAPDPAAAGQPCYDARGLPCSVGVPATPAPGTKGTAMKGNDKILTTLNALLAEELTAINQYMVHSEMCADWGYGRLHEAVEKRAIQEMGHAEKLIGRIIFLEGTPTVNRLNAMHIGADVNAQLEHDLASEHGAVKVYNDAVRAAVELGDNGTRDLLESILGDEEDHVDWLESQLDQIAQMGLPNYLQAQTG
jgi:bacterioferritin